MLQPHLKIEKGDISKFCIVVGDPGRVVKIARHFKNAKLVSKNRGYLVYNGQYGNILVSAVSTGIGGPSAAIAIEELINCGAEIIIRVGSGAVLKKAIDTGDLVVSTGVCKEERSTQAYAPAEFAAVPDFDVLKALIESAKELGKKCHYGVTMSCDGFYARSHRKKMLEWSKMNVIGSDMESSMLFTLSQLRGIKAGFIFYAGLNIIKKQEHKDILRQSKQRAIGEENAILVALHAIKKIKGGKVWKKEKRR